MLLLVSLGASAYVYHGVPHGAPWLAAARPTQPKCSLASQKAEWAAAQAASVAASSKAATGAAGAAGAADAMSSVADSFSQAAGQVKPEWLIGGAALAAAPMLLKQLAPSDGSNPLDQCISSRF